MCQVHRLEVLALVAGMRVQSSTRPPTFNTGVGGALHAPSSVSARSRSRLLRFSRGRYQLGDHRVELIKGAIGAMPPEQLRCQALQQDDR
jgi:hypothetical protein